MGAKCTGGDPLLGCDVIIPVESGVAPGQIVDVEVALVAPNHEGRFISYWRLHDEATGIKFGDRIWVDVSVQAEEDELQQDLKEDFVEDSESLLNDAPEASLKEDTPFAGAIAQSPIIADRDEATDVEAADGASTAIPSETESEATAASAAMTEEPDWVEVGNSLLAMSQTDGCAADLPEGGSPEEEAQDSTAAPSAPAPAPSSASAQANSIEDLDPLRPLLEQLAAMGFSETAATAALAASYGDITAAVAMLIAQQ